MEIISVDGKRKQVMWRFESRRCRCEKCWNLVEKAWIFWASAIEYTHSVCEDCAERI
jgi:hypothetical protein